MTALGNGLVALEDAIECLRDSVVSAADARDAVDKMARLRSIADKMERIVGDANWPLPKYRDMLFLY